MRPLVKQYVRDLAKQMEKKIDLLDPENQNMLVRAIWVNYSADVKASSILRSAQDLRRLK